MTLGEDVVVEIWVVRSERCRRKRQFCPKDSVEKCYLALAIVFVTINTTWNHQNLTMYLLHLRNELQYLKQVPAVFGVKIALRRLRVVFYLGLPTVEVGQHGCLHIFGKDLVSSLE